MRKYLRSIARHNMERAGITQMNKRRRGVIDGKPVVIESKFQQHWREYAHV